MWAHTFQGCSEAPECSCQESQLQKCCSHLLFQLRSWGWWEFPCLPPEWLWNDLVQWTGRRWIPVGETLWFWVLPWRGHQTFIFFVKALCIMEGLKVVCLFFPLFFFLFIFFFIINHLVMECLIFDHWKFGVLTAPSRFCFLLIFNKSWFFSGHFRIFVLCCSVC